MTDQSREDEIRNQLSEGIAGTEQLRTILSLLDEARRDLAMNVQQMAMAVVTTREVELKTEVAALKAKLTDAKERMEAAERCAGNWLEQWDGMKLDRDKAEAKLAESNEVLGAMCENLRVEVNKRNKARFLGERLDIAIVKLLAESEKARRQGERP